MSRRVLTASAWTAMLVAACLVPGRFLHHSETELPVGIPHLDKLVHGVLFAGFALLWAWAGRKPGRSVWVGAVGIALGVLTELAQGLSLIARDPDLLDVLADAAGVIVGLAAWRAWEKGSGRERPGA